MTSLKMHAIVILIAGFSGCKPSTKTDESRPYYYTTPDEAKLIDRRQKCLNNGGIWDPGLEHCAIDGGAALALSQKTKEDCAKVRFHKWDETTKDCVLDQELFQEWEQARCRSKGMVVVNGICVKP